MNSNAWLEVGRLVRLRRERLGLKQDELQQYGGPKVSTVGKFERAAQENFPLRTQHQIEKALGWRLGTIEDVLGMCERNEWTEWRDEYEQRLIEEDIPDLSQTAAEAEVALRVIDATDEELLGELARRMRVRADVAYLGPNGPVLIEAKSHIQTGSKMPRVIEEQTVQRYAERKAREAAARLDEAPGWVRKDPVALEEWLDSGEPPEVWEAQYAARHGESAGRSARADQDADSTISQDPGGIEPA